MKITFVCKCGHRKTNYTDIDNSAAWDNTCSICGERMNIDFDSSSKDIMHQFAVEMVKEKIKETGNDKYWELIDKLSQPIFRCRMRQLFVEAGGKVPIK